MQSEVAHILQQIEIEYIAAQRGLTGLAQSARHAAITARMEHMGLLHKDLQAILGDRRYGLSLDPWKPYRARGKQDVLCDVWKPLTEQKSSGPRLPEL